MNGVKYKILLVDDSRISRLSLIRQLNSLDADFEILQAVSADEAEVVMQDQVVEAALIDFNMVGRNGVELAEVFQRTHPSMRMAIVTANIQDALMKRVQAMGMTFIAKPTNSAQLAAFLEVSHAHE